MFWMSDYQQLKEEEKLTRNLLFYDCFKKTNFWESGTFHHEM